MMHGYGTEMAAGGWLVMGVFWVLLVAAIVWLVLALSRSGRRTAPVPPTWRAPTTGAQPTASAAALSTLDHRLAAGQIDLATYRQLRAELTGGGGPR